MSTSKAYTIEKEAIRAAEVIGSGGIILYPTDTIWGLGCDATNDEAVQRIYGIKEREDSKSMLVLVSGQGMLSRHVRAIPPSALQVLKESTRPSTLIYPEARNLASALLAVDGSVGIRLTSDPFCLKLMKITGVPIVSTSANISGDPSPATFAEISQILHTRVDHIVNWRREEKEPASPSRILKIEKDGTLITLRP